MREALLYQKKEGNKVLCGLCSHRCLIAEGKSGICMVRENQKGVLYAHSYASLVAANIDPIEKKPMFHVLPGSSSYSVAAAGCNFRCDFCQNWEISQKKEDMPRSSFRMPAQACASGAKRAGCKSISYTYTEPTVFFEYSLDAGRLAKKEGLYNVYVTNGFMTKECLDMLKGTLDAANVDLKSFEEDYYKKVCGGSLSPVLESIEYMRRLKIWVEVTTLIVPGLNDSEDELKKIASFLAAMGKEIPWHISRFYPQYKIGDLEPTPLETLEKAQRIGKEAGLYYVYLGNVPPEGENTYCYNCNALLVERAGYSILKNDIKEGRCPKCKSRIHGIWM